MKTLNKEQYWLLDLVCEGAFPIHILLHSQLALVVNKSTGHGLNRVELVDILHRLFEEGILMAHLYENPDDFPVEITPTQRDIETALDGKLDLHFGLTSLGGEMWEEYSKPNWDLYVSGCPSQEEDDEYNPEILKEKWLARISLVRSYIENNGGFDLALSKLEAMSWFVEGTIDLIGYYSIDDECQADLPETNREVLKQVLILDSLLTSYKFDLLSFKIEEWNWTLNELHMNSRIHFVSEEIKECLTGINRKLLEKMLSLRHLISYFGTDGSVIPSSEVWEIVKPWKPTYWKTLPSAHRVRYKVKTRLNEGIEAGSPEYKEWNKVNKWYMKATKWYTPLFEY